MIIKALSVRNPWAVFIRDGLKQYETRDWATQYRGPLAIHAPMYGNRGFTADDHGYMERLKYQFPQVREALAKPMVFGAIVCVCHLAHIYRTEGLRPHLSELEFAIGNFADGRAAWQLEVIEVFAEPIPLQAPRVFFDWERP